MKIYMRICFSNIETFLNLHFYIDGAYALKIKDAFPAFAEHLFILLFIIFFIEFVRCSLSQI
jgi:hypothetical protein